MSRGDGTDREEEASGADEGGRGDDPVDEAPVEIGRFRYRHEAELVRGYLEDAGIPASVIADDADQIQFGKGFASPARILVRARDAEAAREVLRRSGIQPGGDEA